MESPAPAEGHLRLLRAVARATDALLRASDWRATVPSALRWLGEASEVSRVYFFENEPDPDHGLVSSLRAEWCAPGVEPQIDLPDLQRVPFRAAGFARWLAVLEGGGVIAGTLDDLPPEERPLLEPQGILSLAVVPVRTPAAWHGFIGFDDCSSARRWDPAEVDVLRAAAGTLGAAIERHASTTRLRESEESYRTLFDRLAQPVLIVDPDGTIVAANEAALELYGDGGALPGGTVYADLCRSQSEVGELLGRAASGKPVRAEMSGTSMSTSDFPKEVSMASGTYFGRDVVLIIERDLTEWNRLQEQLLQAQRMEAVGKLAGGVAHDFNNMLTAIQGFAAFLETEELSADGRESLEEVQRATTRSIALTRQLLAFSRKQVMSVETLDLSDAVRGVQGLLGRLIPSTIRVEWELHDEPLTVTVDPGQLDQVIVNLAVNARDAMEHGGTLRLGTRVESFDESRPPPVDVMPPGAYATLEVSDSGHGMDAATAARVFEPFFTTKAVGKGTGLGLSTVYGIVKQSHGFITVDSAPGRGTVFRVHLPLSERDGRGASDTDAEEADSGEDEARAAGTVLLVEDEASVRGFVARVLRQQGYEVAEAASGDEALELLSHGPPDLLVTDIVMPGLSGPALVERVRSRHPDLAVLYMSGYSDDDTRSRAGDHRNVGFLGKPFGPAELRGAVAALLDPRT